MYCINCGKKVPDGLYCIKCGWNQAKGTIKGGPQLVDMYMKWSRKHYPRVTKSTVAIYEHAWTKLESLHKFRVVDIKASHFQDIFDDSCHYSMSYLAKMKQLCKHLMMWYKKSYSESSHGVK